MADSERWMEQRLEMIKMKQNLGSRFDKLPEKVRRQYDGCNINDHNHKGETLVHAVIKYLRDDPIKQLRMLNLLTKAGANLNAVDTKQQRTPIMVACIENNEMMAKMLLEQDVDLNIVDRTGNTALMYAVITGNTSTLARLIDSLVKTWSFDVFRIKNVMGNTAEMLAKKQIKQDCARLLSRERLQMLQRMHRQLALMNHSADLKGWNKYKKISQNQTLHTCVLATFQLLEAKKKFKSVSMPDIKQNQSIIQDWPRSQSEELAVVKQDDNTLASKSTFSLPSLSP